MASDTIEIDFYHHCDDNACTLGYAEYRCPECTMLTHDYGDLWWIHDSPKASDDSCKSYCDRCKVDFILTKTKDFNTYKIKKK